MITGADVVTCAWTYLGTPFHHQGRRKGVGIDCAGLVIMVARELCLSTFDVTGYSRQPNSMMFRSALTENLDRVRRCDTRAGDVLSILFDEEQHLAIVTAIEPLTLIHAYEKVGRVIEERAGIWWSSRIASVWRYRGIDG